MPIDEFAAPKDLTATETELSQIELQNRKGLKRETISGLSPGKYLTILAVETDSAISVEEYFGLLSALKLDHGVLAMQTVFAAPIPFYEGYNCDLHMTAHLRLELQSVEIEEVEEPEEK